MAIFPTFWCLFISWISLVNCQSAIRGSSSLARSGACPNRPLGCSLSCPHGFAWGLGDSCLCICQIDPCLSRICRFGEVCVTTRGIARCVSQLATRKGTSQLSTTLGECPRLVGGFCLERCNGDQDCPTQMKCCSNGCGKDCVLPISVAPIFNNLPIQPLGTNSRTRQNAITGNQIGFSPRKSLLKNNGREKIGHCPSRGALKDKNCEIECNFDHDCSSPTKKCCDTGCGKICTAPERATTCIHLLSAVERLPQKQLANGFIPDCSSVDGTFLPVQCDLNDCWCVHSIDGTEIHGTKVPVDQRSDLHCEAPRRCVTIQCDESKCPFGLKTDPKGCPLGTCECKNICDGVTCDNKFDECQLVEPDCAKAPCAPVPRCLLNPCSNGLPMTLPNGVTALCTQSSQCGNDFWCHQIGYNGLGFCCPPPESAARPGFCEARVPRHITDCAAECRSDVDCDATSKCCFDSCGLKCMQVHFAPNPFQHRPVSKVIVPSVDPQKFNKEIISPLLAECPELPRNGGTQSCNHECRSDGDCHGLRRCCVAGCSRICVYPQKTTPCIHEAITHELYSIRNPPKCTSAGNYDEIQCDDDHCYCVDAISGTEVPNTWVAVGTQPNCKAIRGSSCPVLSCPKSCSFGHKLDSNGCSTCECRNPCADVHCPQGQICIVADVICFSKSHCPPQPRCVRNVCQGHPYSSENGLIEPCSNNCPQGYWCNNVGFPTLGGVCCPEVVTSSNGEQIIQAGRVIHAGNCPKIIISAELLASKPSCKARCFTDSDCRSTSKCCFDGCGTNCLHVAGEISSSISSPVQSVSGAATGPIKPVVATVNKNRIGDCPRLNSAPRYDCRSGQDECTNDQDCSNEIQKCCSNGCFRKCLYPQKTTPCLHMKAAYEKTSSQQIIKCTYTGEFEQIQCDSQYCFCVDRVGREVDGTRVSKGLRPDCRARRLCEEPNCSENLSCPFGYSKDSNGCNTCECENPCRKIQCKDSSEICVPHPVDCLSGICPQVPKCVVNVCSTGYPLYHETTWEPVFCREHAQCRGANTHCKVFKNNGGYCCIGAPPPSHPGLCPKPTESPLSFPSNDDKCEVSCRQDDECADNEKCCHAGGCSLACVVAEVDSVAASFKRAGRKIGECPTVDELGSKACGSSRISNCQDDDDCPSVQKCCFDGCSNTCLDAEINTECLHAKAAHDALKRQGVTGVFDPRCDNDGAFEKIQRFKGLSWCVDAHGKEIAGTRSSRKNPDCDRPRSCPVVSCGKHCLFGPEMIDVDGCPTCECKNPCLNIECPLNHVCRIVSIQCFLHSCTPVAKCILNACPRGEPLERADNGQLAECNNLQGHRCPHGWFCHKFGMGSIGYCCPGNVPATQLDGHSHCPAVPILTHPRHQSHQRLECRLNNDCLNNGPCCFNGAGTSCKNGVRRHSGELPVEEVTVEPIKAVTSLLLNIEKIGVCPNNPISNPGCRSDCTRDSECGDFKKCCTLGCGKICQYPQVATACIHKLASVNEELSKMITTSMEMNNENIPLKPPVQCTNDGLFRRIQCDASIRQCWCVDIHSGIEIIGTRTTSLAGQEPNCFAPRFCATSCHDLKCEHGYKLDKTGCPLNGFCQCKSPCEEIKCAKDTDICVARQVKCLNQPCPSVAICRPIPCNHGMDPMMDVHNHIVSCSRDSDCGHGECKLLIGEQHLGVCCPATANSLEFTSALKIGECPTVGLSDHQAIECLTECSGDSDCSGMLKCCSYGCNKLCIGPANATNCIHMSSAIESLQKRNLPVQLHKPQCDPRSGMYLSTQCDDRNCWCVDTVTGTEFYGTKSTGRNVNACSTRQQCPVQCESQQNVCPFGLETNSQGCPKSSHCRCKSLCDQIQCGDNEVCLLRPITSCRDQTCLPVPTCEKNPCSNNQKPAVEPRTYTQFTCLEDRTQICPTGFYCTGYDLNRRGICCPGQEPILAQHSPIIQCPHGDPFSSTPDGIPSECSVSNQGSCPSTHYCLSKPNRFTGICCVTKRYVCNLEKDPGPCNAGIPRYFYNSETQQCEQFMYSGCSGNLNNFGTSKECLSFCVGAGVDILNTALSDNNDIMMDVYSMGFSLTGPLMREKHSPEINAVFLDYITKRFSVNESEIRDLYIKDDNTVRFSIYSPDAKEKAENISNAVSNGNLKFKYKGDVYKAEPQTLFLHQIVQEEANSIFEGKSMYWALLISCVVFAVIVLLALCCGCAFLRRKRINDTTSSYRTSPSPYGQISAYVPHASSAHSPARSSLSQHSVPVLNQRRGTRKQVFSTDEVNVMRQNIVGGGNLLTPVPSVASADGHSVGNRTQGGRRPSRTTLYY